jgi:large subunit ribosomal protein L18
MIKKNKNTRLRSKIKIRSKISGVKDKPRLTIYRSLNNIYAQLVDDSEGNTLVAASSLSKEVLEELKNVKGKISKSKMIGVLVAKKSFGEKYYPGCI